MFRCYRAEKIEGAVWNEGSSVYRNSALASEISLPFDR